MGQVLHGSATTAEAVRRAIQLRQVSVRALAKRYGVSPTTIQKWRKRSTTADARMGPKEARSTKRFADDAIGHFHIDIAEVRTEEGKLYLFVAIDRTSKLAFAKLETEANRHIASAFLQALIEVVPYEIHTVLTDNGQQFCHAPRNRSGPTALYSRHMFDRVCDENGIEHRLTKPQPSLDQRPGRAEEPHPQGCDRQTLPLREPRAAPHAPSAVPGCLQPRSSAQNPPRPHTLRTRSSGLDQRARTLQARSVTSHPGTVHLAEYASATAAGFTPPWLQRSAPVAQGRPAYRVQDPRKLW